MPPAPTLGHLLMRAFRWFDEGLRSSLAAAGWPPITSAQSLVFANLDADGTTTTELARRIGVTRQAVQQVVAALAQQGLVESVPMPGDGRARLVRLTAEGERNVAAAEKALSGLEMALAERIGPSGTAQLRDVLSRDWGDQPTVRLQGPLRGEAQRRR